MPKLLALKAHANPHINIGEYKVELSEFNIQLSRNFMVVWKMKLRDKPLHLASILSKLQPA